MEDGILERARQVGQSGKSIAPQIYVGFGVSGASQHLVGIINAKIIIAINNDPKAPIFDFADYVIVANAGDIVKELIKVDKIRRAVMNKEQLTEYLKNTLAKIMETDVEELDENSSFFKLGVTSIQALKVINKMRKTLNVEINPAVVFEYKCISELAEYLENLTMEMKTN